MFAILTFLSTALTLSFSLAPHGSGNHPSSHSGGGTSTTHAPVKTAPEVDPGLTISSLVFLGGTLTVLQARRSNRSK
jgi:hypothetical protein